MLTEQEIMWKKLKTVNKPPVQTIEDAFANFTKALNDATPDIKNITAAFAKIGNM